MKKAFEDNINRSIDAYKENVLYNKSYERYDFVYEKMKRRFTSDEDITFLDIGSGDSSFIYYLKRKHPRARCHGVEISGELITQARQSGLFNDVQLTRDDARTFRLPECFDFVLMAGVLSIFDELETPLDNMFRHLKDGGWGYIFGGFCSGNIDVLVRIRNNTKKSQIWESGLNMFSLETVKTALKPHISEIWCYPFQLKTNLEKKDDPIRSYTLNTKERGKIIVNGANIIREFFLIEFRKS